MDIVNLYEALWQEKSPLMPILKKFPGKFIHFTEVPKLGINPKKFHSDPYGIYFYPVDWFLATNYKRLHQGDQYGPKMRYHFIVDINLSSNGIILSKLTMADVYKIAQRNRWNRFIDGLIQPKQPGDSWKISFDILNTEDREKIVSMFGPLNRRVEQPEEEQNYWKLPDYRVFDTPAKQLWTLCYYLDQLKILSWNKSLAGITYIYDDGLNIIHNNEPEQILVLSPKIIKILESNVHLRDQPIRPRSQAWNEWGKFVLDIMKHFGEKYSSEVKWKKKDPELRFNIDGIKFFLEFEHDRRYVGSGTYLRLYYRIGRSTGYRFLTDRNLQESTREEVIKTIEEWISEIKIQPELDFVPVISETQIHNFIENSLFKDSNPTKLTWEWEIRNVETNISVTIKHTELVNENTVTTRIYLSINPDYFNISISLLVNGETVNNVDSKFEDFQDCKLSMLKLLEEKVDQYSQIYVRSANEGYYRPKFSNMREWELFSGWVLLNSGLSSAFPSKRIYEYENADEDEKTNLFWNIKQVMKKR